MFIIYNACFINIKTLTDINATLHLKLLTDVHFFNNSLILLWKKFTPVIEIPRRSFCCLMAPVFYSFLRCCQDRKIISPQQYHSNILCCVNSAYHCTRGIGCINAMQDMIQCLNVENVCCSMYYYTSTVWFTQEGHGEIMYIIGKLSTSASSWPL